MAIIMAGKSFRHLCCARRLPDRKSNPSYGLTFWLNQQAPNGREADMERMLDLPWQNAQWTDVCICKEAPADMVVALGSGISVCLLFRR